MLTARFLVFGMITLLATAGCSSNATSPVRKPSQQDRTDLLSEDVSEGTIEDISDAEAPALTIEEEIRKFLDSYKGRFGRHHARGFIRIVRLSQVTAEGQVEELANELLERVSSERRIQLGSALRKWTCLNGFYQKVERETWRTKAASVKLTHEGLGAPFDSRNQELRTAATEGEPNSNCIITQSTERLASRAAFEGQIERLNLQLASLKNRLWELRNEIRSLQQELEKMEESKTRSLQELMHAGARALSSSTFIDHEPEHRDP